MVRPLLTAKNIGRQIDGELLWKDVSFDIFAGDSVALIGASGSGKTLMMRALSLLEPVQVGELLWRADKITNVTRFRAHCVYLQQRASLPDGTVDEALRQPFAFRRHAERSFNSARIVSWLEILGRDKRFLEKQVDKLSGGETQITCLLRALQIDPNVILLDEPTSALDRSTALQVEALMKEWLAEPQQERAYVWVSHDVEQSQRIASQQWTLMQGTISKTNHELE